MHSHQITTGFCIELYLGNGPKSRRLFYGKIPPQNSIKPLRFNSLPLKNDGWKMSFLCGLPIFRGKLLNFRGVSCMSILERFSFWRWTIEILYHPGQHLKGLVTWFDTLCKSSICRTRWVFGRLIHILVHCRCFGAPVLNTPMCSGSSTVTCVPKHAPILQGANISHLGKRKKYLLKSAFKRGISYVSSQEGTTFNGKKQLIMRIYAHTAGHTSMMLPVTNLMIKKDNVKLSKHGAF